MLFPITLVLANIVTVLDVQNRFLFVVISYNPDTYYNKFSRVNG